MSMTATTVQAIAQRTALLAQHAVDTCVQGSHPPSPRLQGSHRERLVESSVLHLRQLCQAMRGESEQLFVDYVDWIRTAEAARGLPSVPLVSQLACLRTALRDELPAVAGETESFMEAALQQLEQPAPELHSEVSPGSLAAAYLDRVLAYDRRGALELVEGALEQGTSVQEVYLEVIQRVQHELGRRWQLNLVTVAQEHICTAISQLVLARLYPRLMHESGNRAMVATCVAGELHELGARMVADFFEMDGWDSTYVGANSPPADVVQILRQRDAMVLAVSATMTLHIEAAAELIRSIRAVPELAHLKVIVGGRPFWVAGMLWKRIGADGCAADAADAVRLGDELTLHTKHRPPVASGPAATS